MLGFTQQEDEAMNRVLKKGGPMETVKEEIRAANKPKMRTVAHFLCDCCNVLIANPDNGFIIHGNIYMADPSTYRGLIGNNFPEKTEGIAVEDVQKTVLCRDCFMKALVSTSKHTKKEVQKDVPWVPKKIDVRADLVRELGRALVGAGNDRAGDDIPF